MYQVVCVNEDCEEHLLLDMRDEVYNIGSPKLVLELNKPGSFEFVIYPDHPEIDSIHQLTTLIKVYRLCNGEREWLYTGRVMSSTKDIYDTGKVRSEGILAFFLDSIVYEYEYQGTPHDYVLQLVKSHNDQVNTEKQFNIRTIDLMDADSNNNIVRSNKNFPTTLEELSNKIIKELDAYIAVEEIDGKYYFDCLHKYDVINTQRIEAGENIIDINKSISAEEIRTVMVGIGAENEDGTRPVVTIENPRGIAKYGRIVGTVEFENVTLMENLKQKTVAYLDSATGMSRSVEVKAVDLNLCDSEIEALQLGYAYVSCGDIVDELMLISKLTLYLKEPKHNTVVLGSEIKSISSIMSHNSIEMERKIKNIASSQSTLINQKVNNATQLITGCKGGYVILDCGENAKELPEQILIMDSPSKEDARNVIRINKNGIGFSTTGYNGVYRNAWTIDGNLVADFVTAGTMLADRIRGGTLEVGGTDLGRDGAINVLDSSNNILAVIDKNGVDVRKGAISGATVTAGGSNNTNGAIYVKDSAGNIRITIDCNGINVNNAFKINMDGKFTAVSIDQNSGAWKQFSDLVDSSDAMRTANEAISKANSAASAASSAASDAKKAADANSKTIKNLNEEIIPQINNWINQLSDQVRELGKAGIS